MSFYAFAQVVCNAFFSAIFSIKVEGAEHLPPVGTGFILVSNHQSFLDPPLLGLRLKDRNLTFMAKEELFHKPVLGWIIKKLGAFPVTRGKRDNSAVDMAIQKVEEGKMLCLFPEGTRSLDGKPLKPKSGAVVIAAHTGADIIPAAITYYNKKRGRRFRSKIVIRYGPLIKNEELKMGKNATPSEIKAASRFVMDKIIEQMDPI